MNIESLIDIVKSYNEEEIEYIVNVYKYAENLHKGQYRQSGEPYITHPLNVAYILAEMHADKNTVCAGLLHDVLEDTNATKEEIANTFNQEIAELVDGVTKLSKMNFSSKQDLNLANTRKIITSITDDVRIIIIKLADRLHNMRTLQFKSEFKQKENALETMEIFVPLSYYIGAYRIKSELEDLSLRYLKPDIYKCLEEKQNEIEEDSHDILAEMLFKIQRILNDKDIPNEIKVRTKNIYGIYKRIVATGTITSIRKLMKLDISKLLALNIHDLLALKIMVDEVDNCYRTLGFIHNEYHPINDKFKDYICNPKTNMYRSLHTTVFGPKDILVQTQIRTFDMDKIASFGLTTYWDINKGKARDVMQKDLKEKFQFFKSLIEINDIFGDNKEFVEQVKNELFSDNVYVFTTKGDRIELPKGSTAIDLAYKIHTDIGNSMVGVYVNDELVPIDYILKSNDRVRIITNILSSGPKIDWLNKVHTGTAKRKIKEFNKAIK